VDVPSFAEALWRGLRQDPDVILVGEMRELETISTAITAAETGHLVLATLHTTGCAGTINRIIDAFPTNQQEQVRVQLSVALICVISQALLPRANGRGLVAAFEIMVMTPAIQNLIRLNKVYTLPSEIQTGSRLGMIMLDDSLARLYERGLITEHEAVARAQNVTEFREKIAGITPRAAPQLEEVAAREEAPTGPPGAAPGPLKRPVLRIGPQTQQK
jgi:twitching motility protein PilT